MASPIAGIPHSEFGVKIFPLIFFLFVLTEISTEEFPILGNYGESLLEELAESPVAINSATVEDLLRLPGVDRRLARAVIKRREERGGFRNLTELLDIPGMTLELWQKISPFLRKEEIKVQNKNRDNLKLRNSFTPEEIYNFATLGFVNQEISFRFLTETDKGEEIFDYCAFNLTTEREDYSLLFGDFFPIGSELIFSPPYFRYYRNFFPKDIQKNHLEPIRFPSETHYLRGLGMELGRGEGFSGTLFFSAKGLTAIIDTAGVVQKIYYNGQHTDSLSRANKGRLKEKSLGGGLRWHGEDFTSHLLFLFSNYNEAFLFGRRLFLIGFSLAGGILGQRWSMDWVKSFPGGWGWDGECRSNWHHFNYQIKLSYQKGKFFNLYGSYPNIREKGDKLWADTKIIFTFPSGRFSFSYNTRVNFEYDSLPQLLGIEWQKKEGRLEFKIYERFYLGETKRGGGLKITYQPSLGLTGSLGIEDKYQKERRGFKFTGKVSLSFSGNKITLEGYKVILNQGIDFYHQEEEIFREREYINRNLMKIILSYERRLNNFKLNFGLDIVKKERYTYTLKTELRYN